MDFLFVFIFDQLNIYLLIYLLHFMQLIYHIYH